MSGEGRSLYRAPSLWWAGGDLEQSSPAGGGWPRQCFSLGPLPAPRSSPHVRMCIYIYMCVCVCLHTPWGPCDFWDLCLPHSPHLTRACVCTCAHACACVCACTCPRLPFFLLPRDVTTSRGLCLQREWGRSLVLPTDSLPPSSQKGVNEQKPDDSGWKSTVCV